MAANFPNSPAVNDTYVVGNVTWTWDGVKWTANPGILAVPDAPSDSQLYGRNNAAWSLAYAASNPSGYQTAAQVTAAVPVASSTTPLVDGTAAVGSGTTWARADHVHPLPSQAIGDNRIINGDMRIDQRNNGASTTPLNQAYVVDRWMYAASVASKFTAQRATAGAGLSGGGFGYALLFTSASAYSAGTAETFHVQQPIEADQIVDFMWGTASAQPVTLSFWVNSSLTGTFSGAISGAATRSYPFTFSIPTANTWTKIAVTIPGDTSGTWVLQGNGVGVYVRFNLGAGSTLLGPANAWAGVNYVGATGSVSVVGTNAATFQVTGVKLEIGSVATSYNRQSPTKSMADCQRYYQYYPGAAMMVQGNTGAGATILNAFTLQTAMRAAPTAAFVSPTYSNASGIALNAADSLGAMVRLSAVITAAGYGYAISAVALTAEL